MVDFVGFQNRLNFFGQGFGRKGFHFVSKSLNQFRFGLRKLAFSYLAFW